jgi:hypothetical protein
LLNNKNRKSTFYLISTRIQENSSFHSHLNAKGYSLFQARDKSYQAAERTRNILNGYFSNGSGEDNTIQTWSIQSSSPMPI